MDGGTMRSRIFQYFCRTAFRLTLVTVFAYTPTAAQTVSVGIKAGLPITDSFVVDHQPGINNSTFDTRRYTVGPTFELRLPYCLAFETDALYKRLSYTSNPFGFDTFRLQPPPEAARQIEKGGLHISSVRKSLSDA